MLRRIKIPALVLAAIALCAIPIAVAYRRNRSLLDRATEIRATGPGGRVGNYAWIDGHTYLTAVGGYPWTQLFAIDTRNGAERVCAAASPPPATIRFRRAPMRVSGTLSPWLHAGVVSPDHTKALWNSTDGWQLVDLATGKIKSMGTGTAGNIPDPRNPAPMENAAWFPNSRDWVSVAWSFRGPSTLEVRDSGGRLVAAGKVGHAAGMPYILGVLPGGIVLLHNCQRVYAVDTRHGFTMRFRDVPFPEDEYAFGAALSPDGRHIAWVCAKRADWPSIPGPLGRIAPYPPVNLTSALYVTDAEGKHPREIGRHTRTLSSNIRSDEYIMDVAWLPDGKHVSFTYHDRLWILPVDAR